MKTDTLRRPTTLILIGILILGGVLTLGTNLLLLTMRGVAASSGVPTWSIYLSLLLGILQIVTAILIFMNQRVGLLLGIGTYIVLILSSILTVVMGRTFVSVIPGIVIAVIALALLFISRSDTD